MIGVVERSGRLRDHHSLRSMFPGEWRPPRMVHELS